MLLLDAHVLLWYATDADDLPLHLKERIEDSMTRVIVSVASQWELMIKAMSGKLSLPDAPERFLTEFPKDAGFRVLDVQPRHVAALAELPEIHGDPFDRMLVAQALVEDLDLVTDDEVVRRYPIRTMW
jgi:PIN domain nuclease of toxin-antitoxin system